MAKWSRDKLMQITELAERLAAVDSVSCVVLGS